MINQDNLKLYTYKELKVVLPAGTPFEKLYEKAKDKEKFDQQFICVYEGNVETEAFNPHDEVQWGVYYKFIEEKENIPLFSVPVILGNVTCKTASLREVLITGNLHTKNLDVNYTSRPNTFSQIMGNVTVDEVLFTTGKGLGGKTFNFQVNGDVNIHTWINLEQAAIKAKSLTVKKEFSFPQVYVTEDRSKHAQKKTDWSRHSLEELTNHFNKEHLNLEEYENYVDFFFRIPTKLSKADYDYLIK